MEAHKERAEQVEREADKIIGRTDENINTGADQKVILAGEKAYEDVIRKAVTGGEVTGEDTNAVTGGGEVTGENMGDKVIENPEDVLVFSRSVQKIDSSLE